MTLRLDGASDRDWAGCPTARKSSSGAVVVWLNGALVSSLCKTQGLIALSSPEAEYYACTVGVAEAKFVQSILLDWCLTAEIEHFVDNSNGHHGRAKDWSLWNATHGNQILVDSGGTPCTANEIDRSQGNGEWDRCGDKTR